MKRQSFLICGILSTVLYAAMNIFIPFGFEGYNSASQTISELSAIGAPTRTVWVWLGFVYTFLVIAFGWGVWHFDSQNKNLRIAGILIFWCGVVSLAWPFTPMHQREYLANLNGGQSLTDTLHLVMGGITVGLWTTALGFGAAALGKSFQVYSIITIIILLFFGILTSFDAPNVSKNLPTPWIGVWERINIAAFMIWVVVLALLLMRRSRSFDVR